MSVTEYERHQLFTWFEEHMGTERATTMMNLVPPVGWGDVATKRDLQHEAQRLDAKIDARFDATDARFGQLRGELRGDLGEMKSDMMRTFGGWLFASQAALIATMALLLATIR